MANIFATIILLGITVFVVSLFPGGKDFIGSITGSLNDKKTNVVEEYERVKGEVGEITDTVKETKEKVDKTIDTLGNAVDTASDTLDKVNSFLGDDDDEEVDQEAWRISNLIVDPSIQAGRVNFNFADPGEDGMNAEHLEMDIKPWIEWGNRGNDKTTKEERIADLAITEKGRDILDELGYEYEGK